eukprot:3641668-Rhodomonas_salina.1
MQGPQAHISPPSLIPNTSRARGSEGVRIHKERSSHGRWGCVEEHSRAKGGGTGGGGGTGAAYSGGGDVGHGEPRRVLDLVVDGTLSGRRENRGRETRWCQVSVRDRKRPGATEEGREEAVVEAASSRRHVIRNRHVNPQQRVLRSRLQIHAMYGASVFVFVSAALPFPVFRALAQV